jgi:hypothetical protein
MAIIDSSGYRILDSRTVVNILTFGAVQSSKNYPHIRSSYFDVKKTTESKVLITVKPAYASNIEKIYDDVAKLFSIDVLLGNRQISTTSEISNVVGINFILNLQQQVKNVKIYFKLGKDSIKSKLPELLRPGVLNEEYFNSVINDAIDKLNEAKTEVGLPKIFNPKLLLGISENNITKYTIGPIKSSERIGQELGKTDVRIKTDSEDINISLKKENFSFWSSASQYAAAKNIMDHLVKTNQIQISKNGSGRTEIKDQKTGKKIEGIKLPATVGEIKKYCFGEDENKINYILINSYNPGDFAEVRRTGMSGQFYKLDLNSKIVYTETVKDIVRMKGDVYLTIVPSSSNSSALMPNYPGFKIQFANKKNSSKYFVPNVNGTFLQRI